MQIGADCKLYRNTGTWGTPVWDEIPLVRDLQQNLSKGKADASNRGSGGWKISIGTLKEGALEFDIIWESGDADFEALRDSFFNDTVVDLAALDMAVGTDGAQGLRAEMGVFEFSRAEQLEGLVTAAVKCSPGSITNSPVWMEVSA